MAKIKIYYTGEHNSYTELINDKPFTDHVTEILKAKWFVVRGDEKSNCNGIAINTDSIRCIEEVKL